MTQRLRPQALTADGFAPFGDVIECTPGASVTQAMNDARFARHHALSRIDHDADTDAIISIVECLAASALPFKIELIERHPLGSQAFMPLSEFEFLVVVAAAGENPRAEELHAFISNGNQGIAYHRGTWHMPLIGLSAGQQFLLVEADGARPNCDELIFDTPVWLEQA